MRYPILEWMKAVIPVAGFGTRFLPATKTQPKEMLSLVDTPVIQYVVEEIVDSGITNIIFVTSKYKKGLEDYFDSHNELEITLKNKGNLGALRELRRIERLAHFSFVRQKQPMGNADALMAAAHIFGDKPVVLAFGDDVFLGKELVTKKLLSLYAKYNAPVCVLKRVSKKDVSRYGIVQAKKIGKGVFRITDIVEKPDANRAPSSLAVFGRYVMTPELISCIHKLYPPKKGKEVGVTDAIKMYLDGGGEFYGYEVSGDSHFDCGSKVNFMKAIVYLGLQHPEIKNEFRKYLRSLEL